MSSHDQKKKINRRFERHQPTAFCKNGICLPSDVTPLITSIRKVDPSVVDPEDKKESKRVETPRESYDLIKALEELKVSVQTNTQKIAELKAELELSKQTIKDVQKSLPRGNLVRSTTLTTPTPNVTPSSSPPSGSTLIPPLPLPSIGV